MRDQPPGAVRRRRRAERAYAAARRPVHFHISNEFGDWDTVHHTFTYTNAVERAMRRAPSRELARGIFDGAMSVYLERFLNTPRQAFPTPAATSAPCSRKNSTTAGELGARRNVASLSSRDRNRS